MSNEGSKISKGKILIADPILDEVYFRRGVILLSDHTDEGTIGFVLNKQIDLKIGEAIEELTSVDMPVYLGGPVSKDSIYYVHTLGHLIEDSFPINDTLSFGGHFDTLKELIIKGKVKENQVRFFLGYSGWATGQLEKELKSEAWIVSNMKRNYVFDTSKNLWHDALIDMGKEYALIANFPDDPSMN
jgi:putative transcriptional regulator